MMVRMIAAAGLAAFVLSAPAQAATSKEKVETCAFGADELKLIGAKRKAYMAKCTSNQDSPRGKPIRAPAGAPKPQ
jgi:hypothetical protein